MVSGPSPSGHNSWSSSSVANRIPFGSHSCVGMTSHNRLNVSDWHIVHHIHIICNHIKCIPSSTYFYLVFLKCPWHLYTTLQKQKHNKWEFEVKRQWPYPTEAEKSNYSNINKNMTIWSIATFIVNSPLRALHV